jgi:monothiol glutaredoxin
MGWDFPYVSTHDTDFPWDFGLAATEEQAQEIPELKQMIDSGQPFELVDVRSEDERALSRIEGSRLLDQAYHDDLLTRDRNTPIVFQCHHGVRSQGAAEYFLQHGFRNLYNLQGGIDAWSQLVDPSVPRY